MTDRRAKTSRANLGDHIPEALGSGPSTPIAVRVPPDMLEWIDRLRGGTTRSDFMRAAAAAAIDFARHPMNYTALLLDDGVTASDLRWAASRASDESLYRHVDNPNGDDEAHYARMAQRFRLAAAEVKEVDTRAPE